ncbi:hypothetical protein Psi02_77440 [Planotetraspora silvatica]|uniref:Suppressor of fused-like domain-containing protein n=1 Tax=Planotetraspora silvatica TaxID=234614 RepID=A0A8J3XSN1_9ACTN|nr:hypothetical protein Psi02_77440 [Planotetraspora silvatica]
MLVAAWSPVPSTALDCAVVDEVSGAGIVRHEPRYDGFVAAAGQRQEVAEAIDRHIATHFGPVAFVLHEIASHLVGVHVYVVGPSAERPYQTLVTSGMSERPMTVPDGHGISPYAELMLCLPADWPLTQAALHDERTGWPVRVLKQVARLPHEYGTWITLLALIPLHPAEVMLKVSQGTDALIAALDRGGVSELLDPTRPSLV